MSDQFSAAVTFAGFPATADFSTIGVFAFPLLRFAVFANAGASSVSSVPVKNVRN